MDLCGRGERDMSCSLGLSVRVSWVPGESHQEIVGIGEGCGHPRLTTPTRALFPPNSLSPARPPPTPPHPKSQPPITQNQVRPAGDTGAKSVPWATLESR